MLRAADAGDHCDNHLLGHHDNCGAGNNHHQAEHHRSDDFELVHPDLVNLAAAMPCDDLDVQLNAAEHGHDCANHHLDRALHAQLAMPPHMPPQR